MRLQMGKLSEKFTTRITFVWLLSGVDSLMEFEVRGPTEVLTAHPARVWLLPRVDAAMHCKVQARRVALPALLTLERLFSRVDF